jgi:hypothetical protein
MGDSRFTMFSGLGIGQIVIAPVILALAYAIVRYLNYPQQEWNLVISGAAWNFTDFYVRTIYDT